MAQSKTEAKKKSLIIRAIIAVVIIAALLLSLIWTDKINEKLGLIKTVDGKYNGASTAEVLEKGADLNVHFLDVGQGDCCIIQFPDNRTMLIDAGEDKSAHKKAISDYIKENIKDESGNAITYFDFAVLTHPDSDHCGGMGDILTEYPAKNFYRPGVYTSYEGNPFVDPATKAIQDATGDVTLDGKGNDKNTKTYEKAIQAGYNESNKYGITTNVYITGYEEEYSVITPEGLSETDADYYTFTFYGPAAKTYTDWNDYSPIMILDYHEKRFMLSGDSEKEGEAGFVKLATAPMGSRQEKYSIFTDDFTVDVFKLGHHGSKTSSSEDFINVMTTEANCPNVKAIISCGKDNKYGHPHSQVLSRLNKLGFSEDNIVRTDVNGNIVMSVKCDEGGEYQLYMGAQAVRRTAAAIGNDTIELTWKEIVILLIIVVVAVFIFLPLFYSLSKKQQKEIRKAVNSVQGTSSSGGSSYKSGSSSNRGSSSKSNSSKSGSRTNSGTKRK